LHRPRGANPRHTAYTNPDHVGLVSPLADDGGKTGFTTVVRNQLTMDVNLNPRVEWGAMCPYFVK